MIITRNARRATLVALAVLLSLPLVSSASAQHDPDRKAERVERFAEALELSDVQRQILLAAEPEPGALWNVAAALTPTLSDAQKEKLFARPERAQRDGKKRRGKRGQMRSDRPGDAERAERREEAHDVMQSALNLTDAQVAELDALREARKAEREAGRAEREAQREARMKNRTPGELPNELASILTPDQQEVFKVHRALAVRMHHARRRGGHRSDR